jgi:hypothetical protein
MMNDGSIFQYVMPENYFGRMELKNKNLILRKVRDRFGVTNPGKQLIVEHQATEQSPVGFDKGRNGNCSFHRVNEF